ncbi:MAG: response regulator, partial [Armatimonadetes bacterium]|nr:response regulator [Armatimonadota bacterium]
MAGTSTHTHTVWMPEAFAVTGAWPVPSVDATMPPHRILIVDDSRTFREAAARFLSRHPDMVVVGHASSGEDALSQTDRLRPDLVLMDLTMPGMNG